MGITLNAWIGLTLIGVGAFASFLFVGVDELGPRVLAHAVTFLGVGVLSWHALSFRLNAAIVLTGVISAVVLGAADWTGTLRFKVSLPRSVFLLRFLIGACFSLMIWLYLPVIASWLPVSRTTIFGSLLIFVFGLLSYALGVKTVDRFIGLLCLIQGFLMIYVSLESSIFVFGVLLFFQLMLSFLGALALSEEAPEEVLSGDESIDEEVSG